jgi:hypothetical protein
MSDPRQNQTLGQSKWIAGVITTFIEVYALSYILEVPYEISLSHKCNKTLKNMRKRFA